MDLELVWNETGTETGLKQNREGTRGWNTFVTRMASNFPNACGGT